MFAFRTEGSYLLYGGEIRKVKRVGKVNEIMVNCEFSQFH